MQTTAESGSVPTKTTVSSRLADATGHRVDELTSQYRRVTGERCDVSDPEEICVVLTEWIRENESVVQALLDDATATFDGISLDDLEAVFEMAWNDGEIGEGELVAAAVRQQAEAYEKVRDLLGARKTRGSSCSRHTTVSRQSNRTHRRRNQLRLCSARRGSRRFSVFGS